MPRSRRKDFSAQPVLADGERARVRPDRNDRRDPLDRRDVDVLELVGDDIDGAREALQRRRIGIVGDRLRRAHIEGRAFRIGAEDVAAEAEARRGERQHAAELAAAQNPDGGAGRQRPPASSAPR